MKFTYSDLVDRLGLILPVLIRPRGANAGVQAEAMVDTGADISSITEGVRNALDLKLSGHLGLRGLLDQASTRVPTYLISLSVGDYEFDDLELPVTPDPLVILGRDLLRDMVLLADGPRAQFELTPPRESAG